MNQNYIDELSEFALEQLVSSLEVTMVSAGYDDIRAEYDEETKTVCLTQYGVFWKPVFQRWISTDEITGYDLFHLLFYSWIGMSESTTITPYTEEIIDNLLFSMLEAGFSNIFVKYSESIIFLSDRKRRTVSIDTLNFSDAREILKMVYVILNQFSESED